MHYGTPKDKRARYVRCMCTYLMILLLLWAVCVCILLLVLANHNAFKLHYGALFCSWSWRTIIYHDAFNIHYGTLSDWLRISHTLQYSIPSSHKKTTFACPFTTCSFMVSSRLYVHVHDPVYSYLRAFVWCWPFTQRVSNNQAQYGASWLLLCLGLGCKISITVVTCIALLLLLSSTVYNNMLTTSSFLPSSTLSILKVIIIRLHYYSPLHNTQHSKQKSNDAVLLKVKGNLRGG